MTTLARRFVATLAACSVSFASVAQTLPAGAPGDTPVRLIATEQATAPAGRALLERSLQRADVVAALQARGVNVDAARARVAALTDEEAAQVAAEIDKAPAGGDVVGTIVFIFVLLLITDILGFTKVFPFTRPIR
ncbi:MAG TPA: PA2779 family protein [Burkholderiaceae bacterium]|nr:PA2779 family protein [Burkholderiaceae bacterium]